MLSFQARLYMFAVLGVLHSRILTIMHVRRQAGAMMKITTRHLPNVGQAVVYGLGVGRQSKMIVRYPLPRIRFL